MTPQKVTPFLWFAEGAEAAARFYVTLFPNSRVLSASPMSVTFELAGQRIMALNGGPTYRLTAAFSLFVSCEDQAEVDQLWDALLADGGKPTRCGWLEDRFGLSWQVIPKQLMELMSDPDPERSRRVVQAMMQMVKIDVEGLRRAHAGG